MLTTGDQAEGYCHEARERWCSKRLGDAAQRYLSKFKSNTEHWASTCQLLQWGGCGEKQHETRRSGRSLGPDTWYLWASYLTIPNFSFFLYKIRIIRTNTLPRWLNTKICNVLCKLQSDIQTYSYLISLLKKGYVTFSKYTSWLSGWKKSPDRALPGEKMLKTYFIKQYFHDWFFKSWALQDSH